VRRTPQRDLPRFGRAVNLQQPGVETLLDLGGELLRQGRGGRHDQVRRRQRHPGLQEGLRAGCLEPVAREVFDHTASLSQRTSSSWWPSGQLMEPYAPDQKGRLMNSVKV